MKRKRLIILSLTFIIILVSTILLSNLNMYKNKEVIAPVSGTISAGSGHTVAVKSDGTVIATGRNDEGQCEVSDWTDIVQVSAGMGRTVGLKSDGTVVAVGRNGIEEKVSSWKDIVYVSAGYYVFGITKDGKVVSTANNCYLGIGNYEDIIFVNESFSTVTVIDTNSTVYSLAEESFEGKGQRINKFISSYENPVSVQANVDLCGVLDSDGNLYLNNLGALLGFVRTKYSNVAQFDLDFFDTIILKNNGDVKIIGSFGDSIFFYNRYRKELKEWNDIISVESGGNHFIGLRSDGTIVAVGSNEDGQCNVEEWTDIATEPLPMDLGNN